MMIFRRNITNSDQQIEAKENSLAYMIGNLENAISYLTEKVSYLTAAVENLKEENIETTNNLYELENMIQSVDNRIDILFNEKVAPVKDPDESGMTYLEAVKSGWSMTDDGFWIPPEK